MRKIPKFIVWRNDRGFHLTETLVESLEIKIKHGGTIYEPLGMDAARQIAELELLKETVAEFVAVSKRILESMDDPGGESLSDDCIVEGAAAVADLRRLVAKTQEERAENVC